MVVDRRLLKKNSHWRKRVGEKRKKRAVLFFVGANLERQKVRSRRANRVPGNRVERGFERGYSSIFLASSREDKFKNLHYTGKVGLCRDQFLHLYDIEIRARTCRGTDAAAGGRIIPRKVLTSVQKRGKGFRSRDSGLRILSPFLRIFCGSGHVSIIESLASTGTDEFQLVAGWPMSRGPRMGFPGFCTSSFHGATRSFAFRPYLSFSPLSLSLPLPPTLPYRAHMPLSPSLSLLFLRPLSDRFSFLVEPAELLLLLLPPSLSSSLLHLEGVVFYGIAGRLD